MRASMFSLLFAAAAAVACSATNSDQAFTGSGGNGGSGTSAGASGPGTGPGSSQASSGVGGGFGTGGSTGSGGSGAGCSAAAELVYVFSLENDIWSFDPPSKQFVKIATPDCPAGGQPNSMAIDRNLVAWLNYIGEIYTFDLKTKTGCQLALTPPSPFEQVGMGFSTDQSGGMAETLYVDSIGGGGLAKIVNNTLIPIGGFANDPNLDGQSAELTGTGDARLFGYFTTFPNVRVAELEKTTAKVLSDHELQGVAPPSDWAFSFWGGDFYLYAAPGNNATGNTTVIHYNPTTQAVDAAYVPDVGFQIIGAGVSTCAPVKPPN